LNDELENGEGNEGSNEALMILGVDRPVSEDVQKALVGPEGMLEASVVNF
jgi:D-3-phosphoglycerate dehydrogenase